MKIEGRKIAVSGLTRVVLIPMRKEEDFVLAHKKGEEYTKFNLKYPFWHKEKYTENQYRDVTWFGHDDEYSESYLREKYSFYIFKDGEVYIKPYVNLVYLDGKERTEHYDTYQEAKERYDELMYECDLKEVVNDCD